MADYTAIVPPTVGGDNDTWGDELVTIFGEIDDALLGASTIQADLKEGAWSIGGTDVTATAAEINKLDGITGNLLTDAQTDTLTKGFNVTSHNAGTKSTGTYTPDPADGNFQYATNGGAHTLAPPASDCAITILYTNNGSAGAITTSGFTSVRGSFTTTNAARFFCDIRRVNGVSLLIITTV